MRRVVRWLTAPVPALSIATVLTGTDARAQQAPPPSPAPAAPATLPRATIGSGMVSLRDCVAIALRDNPDAQSSGAEVRVAEAQRAEVRGAFGPKLHFDGNLQFWDSSFSIGFAPPGSTGSVPFKVRDAFTAMASVSVIQPITPIFAIYDEYKVREFGVDVAQIRREATRRNVAMQTIQAYYELLEARRLAAVAEASVTQLDAQEKQAHSQFDNGVIGKNDLLRATLALASAKQRAIQTRGQVVIARGQLASAMGRNSDEGLEPEPFDQEPPPASETALDAAEAHAVTQRLELRDVARRVQQAEKEVSFARAKLFPIINAVGNYTHNTGSPFQQSDAFYAGLAASWDVWDWGTTLGGVREASARLSQAEMAKKKLEDQVRLEARQAFVNAQSAREALGVARTAVSQAEENYRIVAKKFEANAATSFDMVDAESLLTQARGQVEQALYEYLIACAALQKATGAPLPGEG
jgi:outer membrane protein